MLKTKKHNNLLLPQLNISNLVLLAKADYFGRSISKIGKSSFDAGNWLLLEAEKKYQDF